MPTEAFEDSIDLTIGLLEVVRPASPYPVLRPMGETDVRTFPSLLLENASLRVTILPTLGGRIHSIWDKRTETEILATGSLLVPTLGGSRGVELASGIEIVLQGGPRPNALGPVDVQIEEPPEAAWIAECVGGTGLSFHLRIELPPDRAELRLECRVLNRTERSLMYDGGLAISLGDGTIVGDRLVSLARRAGLRIVADDLPHAAVAGGILRRTRLDGSTMLGPRAVDVWSATLLPFSGLDAPNLFSGDLAASLAPDRLAIQAVEPLPGARLLLGLADGQTLESAADLYPEHVLDIPLAGLPAAPVALVVQDADRHERMRGRPEAATPLAGPKPLPTPPDPALDDLRPLLMAPAHRTQALRILGHRALSEGRYAEADEWLEKALLYNADDPLNWWTKAMARRLAGTEEEESVERLNGHFLAPMEPMLRAEAFLSMPHAMGKEPSPLVAPFADRPDTLVEVAAILLEVGVVSEAVRWIDEALRHGEVAMLRYLYAWALLRGSRMEAEAATQMSAASRLPFAPPYPWREIERTALRELTERFPADPRLMEYASLVE